MLPILMKYLVLQSYPAIAIPLLLGWQKNGGKNLENGGKAKGVLCNINPIWDFKTRGGIWGGG